ncbi:MAG TPA: ABC transporter substrate-binding protein [Chloroflexota bacterium]|nr:ABC transporter substrate-binding protein [Chloroflexota bacterium]
MSPKVPVLIVMLGLLAACGSNSPAAGGQPSSSASAVTRAASAKPASGATAEPKPEKAKLTLALPADDASAVPIRIAQDLGYFSKHGLEVDASIVSASTAAQALASGSVDMYQGGTTPIVADLAGADLIYVAATVDKSTLTLIGAKGITTFGQLRGKSVATTSPGAFGEIALRLSAKKYGLEIGKDIKLLYHPHSTASLTTFLSGQADAFIGPTPYNTIAENKGYPVIIDYFKEGLRIPGPALSTSRAFYAKNPNAIRAYLMGYLDGLRKTIDDPALAKQTESKHTKVTDATVLDSDYKVNLQTWNKDLRIDPKSIQNVLDGLGTPQAQAADPKRFYDNTVAAAVTRDYAAKLFPSDVKP